ncbi:unnamed protein product [Gongylonema pulchrum]|uniref:Uncharacterized protein n=1 Tax=Gongylonema pulchrum TaxID=637853 RepID=A0A3P6RU33_9BILA|nr:unnamed protein product [Gongylonema pulchrum]
MWQQWLIIRTLCRCSKMIDISRIWPILSAKWHIAPKWLAHLWANFFKLKLVESWEQNKRNLLAQRGEDPVVDLLRT